MRTRLLTDTDPERSHQKETIHAPCAGAGILACRVGTHANTWIRTEMIAIESYNELMRLAGLVLVFLCSAAWTQVPTAPDPGKTSSTPARWTGTFAPIAPARVRVAA